MVENIDKKITWIAVGIFALSGILPWFVVNFQIGTLNISVFDVARYFTDAHRVPIDFYSSAVYAMLLVGWVFSLGVVITASVFQKLRLYLFSAVLVTGTSILWAITAPYLQVHLIFLSLANQPITLEHAVGPGQIAAIMSGLVMGYLCIKSKLS